jgi:hypothetical protein
MMIIILYVISIIPNEYLKKYRIPITRITILSLIRKLNEQLNSPTNRTKNTYQSIIPILISILLTFILLTISKIIENPQNPIKQPNYEKTINQKRNYNKNLKQLSN